MPRMSNKRRFEWSFFLNHRNRITYNDLCRGCTRDCKQSFRAIIILCPPVLLQETETAGGYRQWQITANITTSS